MMNDSLAIEKGKNRRQMIYSFNIESMQRKNGEESVPNSIIEEEFDRIREPQKDFVLAQRTHAFKQEAIHEKAR